MQALRWFCAALLLAVFAVFASLNVLIVMRWIVLRRPSSLAPIVGGLAGCMGLLVSPAETLRSFWWVPLVADIGALPLVVPTLVGAGSVWAKKLLARRP